MIYLVRFLHFIALYILSIIIGTKRCVLLVELIVKYHDIIFIVHLFVNCCDKYKKNMTTK